MHYNEHEWFENLNEKSSVDETINALLPELDDKQREVAAFQNCTFFSDNHIKRVVKKLKSEGLVTIGIIYGSTGYSLEITTKGSNIIENGGWSKYLENKNKPQKLIELVQNYNNNFNGTTNITDSNFQSPNAKIEKVHGYDETINVINTLIENIRHNQDMEHVFQSQLVDIYTDLLSIAQKSKESKLPVIEQIFSVAANIKNLFPFIQS